MTASERASTPAVDFLRPIIADADTGHGGLTAVMRLTKMFVEAGAAGIHFEDQKPGNLSFFVKKKKKRKEDTGCLCDFVVCLKVQRSVVIWAVRCLFLARNTSIVSLLHVCRWM